MSPAPNVVEENSTKGVSPTAVFWNPRAQTAPAAVTVCYVPFASIQA